MYLEEAYQLLKPGYLPLETGFCRLDNGQMLVAALTTMPNCKGQWVEWWFGTHLADTRSYRQWDPGANLNLKWDKTWSPGNYIGSSHCAELLMGGKIFKFVFKYIDPALYFDVSKFKEANVSAVICEEGYTQDGTLDDHTIIVVRDTDYGCEVRTRCWIYNGSDEMGSTYLIHFLTGMRNMGEKLGVYIKNSQKLREKTNIVCKYCRSKDVVKNGLYKNSQYWLCRACGHAFLNNHNLPRMKYAPDTIANAVHSYYSGNSINNICKSIEPRYNVLPSSSTVYGWVKKLTEIALTEEQKYNPLVSTCWIVAETVLRLNRKAYYLYNVIDFKTRFLLAITLTGSENRYDTASLLLAASQKAQKTPDELISSNSQAYRDGLKMPFGGQTNKIRFTPLSALEPNASSTDYCQGTLIERLKPWYGAEGQSRTQVILDGFAFHYNYMRINENLGSVPATAAMIKNSFRSWLDVIRS
jgi:transposase-like protein